MNKFRTILSVVSVFVLMFCSSEVWSANADTCGEECSDSQAAGANSSSDGGGRTGGGRGGAGGPCGPRCGVMGRMIDFTMMYRSSFEVYGPLGYGWSGRYLARLEELADGDVLFYTAKARTYRFVRNPDGTYQENVRTQHQLSKNPDGTFELWDRKGGRIVSRMLFDTSGKLLELSDRYGNKDICHYDESGRLVRITESFSSKEVTITYNAEGLIETVTFPGNRTATMGYTQNADELYDLTSVTDQAGHANLREYSPLHNLVSRTDKGGNTWSWEFDEIPGSADYDRFTARTDPLGRGWEHAYNDMLGMTIITDPEGNVSIKERNEFDKLTRRVDELGNMTRWEYDGRGNLTKRIEPSGAVTLYEYDANDNMVRQEDARGNVWKWEYEPAFNRVTRIEDSEGGVIRYEYDENGNRIKEIDQLGFETEYTCNTNGQIIAKKDSLGNIWKFEYYEDGGELRAEIDPLSNRTEYAYTENGYLETRADPLGNTWRWEYNLRDEVTADICPLGVPESYTYNGNGNRTSITDRRGKTTHFEYDHESRLTKRTDPLSAERTFAYNFKGNRIYQKDEVDGETFWGYDIAGRPALMRDAEEAETTYEYDENRNLIRTTYADDSQFNYTYTLLNQVKTITDAEGAVVTNIYDGAGRPVAVVDSGGTETRVCDLKGQMIALEDREGGISEWVYDGLGQMISQEDPNDNVTSSEYDAAMRLVRITAPDGAETLFFYDAARRQIVVQDPLGRVAHIEYDAADRVTKVTTPDGVETEYKYEATLVTNVIVAGIRTEERSYDDVGRLISRTDALGNTSSNIYDLKGRLITTIDAEGGPTDYGYDFMDRIVAQMDPAERETFFEYNVRGNLVALTDANGHTRTFAHDRMMRLTKRTDAIGNSSEYTYDGRGNLISRKKPDGSLILYEYDGNNRRTARTYPDDYQEEWTYDATGNVLTKDSPAVYIEYAYDTRNRLVSQAVTKRATDTTRTISYQYDMAGNKTNMLDQLGGKTVYTYDDMDRMIGIADPDGLETTFEYDAWGRRTEMGYPNDTSADYVYDNAHRLLEIATEDRRGKSVCAYSYLYNKVGNRIAVGDADNNGWGYLYDKAYQLTGAVAYKNEKPRFAIEYGYDPAGNRTRLDLSRFAGPHVKPILNVKYEYNEADELLKSVTTGAEGLPVGWEEAYTYDKNGNTISKVGTLTRPGCCFARAGEIAKWLWETGEDGDVAKWLYKRCDPAGEGEAWQRTQETTYQWDYENMLAKASLPCDRQEEYWNCTCRTKRVAKCNADGVYREYAFDPLAAVEHILIEYDENGTPVARYTLGPRVDEIVSKKDLLSGEIVFYHYEGLGSVVALTDEKGHKKAEYKYTPFGAPLDWKNNSKVENWYTFTGRYHDEHTGLRYHRARYVDPRIGRWLSRDPIGELMLFEFPDVSLKRHMDELNNLYLFVNNSPIFQMDPLGLYDMCVYGEWRWNKGAARVTYYTRSCELDDPCDKKGIECVEEHWECRQSFWTRSMYWKFRYERIYLDCMKVKEFMALGINCNYTKAPYGYGPGGPPY